MGAHIAWIGWENRDADEDTRSTDYQDTEHHLPGKGASPRRAGFRGPSNLGKKKTRRRFTKQVEQDELEEKFCLDHIARTVEDNIGEFITNRGHFFISSCPGWTVSASLRWLVTGAYDGAAISPDRSRPSGQTWGGAQGSTEGLDSEVAAGRSLMRARNEQKYYEYFIRLLCHWYSDGKSSSLYRTKRWNVQWKCAMYNENVQWKCTMKMYNVQWKCTITISMTIHLWNHG